MKRRDTIQFILTSIIFVAILFHTIAQPKEKVTVIEKVVDVNVITDSVVYDTIPVFIDHSQIQVEAKKPTGEHGNPANSEWDNYVLVKDTSPGGFLKWMYVGKHGLKI
jgi:hypothetical protein